MHADVQIHTHHAVLFIRQTRRSTDKFNLHKCKYPPVRHGRAPMVGTRDGGGVQGKRCVFYCFIFNFMNSCVNFSFKCFVFNSIKGFNRSFKNKRSLFICLLLRQSHSLKVMGPRHVLIISLFYTETLK